MLSSKCVFREKKCAVLVTQSCPTICDPMDYSSTGSSVHGILQARILERVAIPFSRGSSWPRDRTWVSRIAGRSFTVWATRGALGKEAGLWECLSLSSSPITEQTARYPLRCTAFEELCLGVWPPSQSDAGVPQEPPQTCPGCVRSHLGSRESKAGLRHLLLPLCLTTRWTAQAQGGGWSKKGAKSKQHSILSQVVDRKAYPPPRMCVCMCACDRGLELVKQRTTAFHPRSHFVDCPPSSKANPAMSGEPADTYGSTAGKRKGERSCHCIQQH